MARPIVLSNGDMHVGINRFGLVHDFYYPFVGYENHAAGKSLRHRVGVWIDGTMSWLDDGSWSFEFAYHDQALIGITTAVNQQLGVMLEIEDAVDSDLNCFLRNIHIVNLTDSPKNVRLFMHQAFVIGDTRSFTDTGQYLPSSHAILHYKGNRAFVIGGKEADNHQSFDQFSVGLFGIENRQGTYCDAEDGELSGCPVEHGMVDSTIRFVVSLEAHGSRRVHYWVAAGHSIREALEVHKQLQDEGMMSRMHATVGWWHDWLQPALQLKPQIEPSHQERFIQSVMIIKSQIDNRGAVIASTDSRMLQYWRDAYAYCWPRDGAYCVWPLIRMGYRSEPEQFFEFCKQVMHPSGYLMHKYRADGALGSSWHPYVHSDGTTAPPIQEDETALVVFVFSQFYQVHQDAELLERFYNSMIAPMANFMARYVDQDNGLPRPTYDLWEEQFLTTTYTTAATCAALQAASTLAEAHGDDQSAVRWRLAAEEMYKAASAQLFNPERSAFYKGLLRTDDNTQYNQTLDMSALFGAFMFGLFPLESDEFKANWKTIINAFAPDGITGIPRYENDNYLRDPATGRSNWWPICSLWMAECLLEMGDRKQAMAILDWVASHMSSTGVLSEQINPETNQTLSVEPLTWSHAEYVACLLDASSKHSPSSQP